MNVTIRKFEARDIPDKVRWVNDPENNRYLHYDLPLREDKTLGWFQKNHDRADRYDATIEADCVPVGLTGLLGIDLAGKKAEYYIMVGDSRFKGTKAAFKASLLVLDHAFRELRLNRVFCFTEFGNIAAQKLFEKIGFKNEGPAKEDLYYNGRYVGRYIYGISRDDYLGGMDTPVYMAGEECENSLYIKRDDLFPFSLGGNKARKGMLFWKDLKQKKADHIVTYGSSSSNHCRVAANIAAAEGIPCTIITPVETARDTFNKRMAADFGAKTIYCKLSEVHGKIEETLAGLRAEGADPYFIQGGGHGNIGTAAYVGCYDEIVRHEKKSHVHFDYIFHASGTGTTQAGLVCGKLLSGDERKIVGISIARKCPYGRNVVKESVMQYLRSGLSEEEAERNVIFDDSFIVSGYGSGNEEIKKTVFDVMCKYGIPLDMTYTGKAFWGMRQFLLRHDIKNKNILFIHTGGIPLFFDDLK